MVEEKTEFYVPVTNYAGVGGPPLCVFMAEIIGYVLLELVLQVDDMKRYAEIETNLFSFVDALFRITGIELAILRCFFLGP